MKQRILASIIIGLLSFPLTANTGHYEEWTAAGGKINWTTGQVTAEGYGVAPKNGSAKAGPLLACRAAIVDAQRNLLEATQGVRVTSTSIIDNYMLASDEVKSSVEGVIRNARITSREPLPGGECRVEMRFALAGEASKTIYRQLANQTTSWYQQLLDPVAFALIPKAHAQDSDTQPQNYAPWSQAVLDLNKRLSLIEGQMSVMRADTATTARTSESGLLPTGLVVDARGSRFIPSLSPKIRQLRGGVVYPDQKKAAAEKFIQRGQLVSLFATDVEFALVHPTVGARPLLVKALRTYGDTRTEIVLSSDEAKKIDGLDEEGFFADAGVIIVLD